MSYLGITSVAKQYGGRTVLRDVTLQLDSGEFLSLLGPSGCGKTTLLRIVAGFEQPERGTVHLAGRDITTLPASRRRMGMVFQAYSLFPNMTAADNVRFGLRVQRLAAVEQVRRVEEMLALVGLSEHAGKYPHQLSGGQQQRVALARALAIQPTLLLLDEPLSALDAKVRVQLREEIRRIQQETRITTVFVTHDQEEALSISDRVAVMHQGELVQVGDPARIYGEPEHIFVAQFIGAASGLPGRVIDSAAGLVELGGIRLPVVRARGLAQGSQIRLFLRPEHVRLSVVGSTPPADTLLGRVRERTFFGAVTRVHVGLEGDASLLADLSSDEASLLRIGTLVSAAWSDDAPRVFCEHGSRV